MSIKGQGYSLTLAKSQRFKNQNFVFSETVGPFETKVHMKTVGRLGMEFIQMSWVT